MNWLQRLEDLTDDFFAGLFTPSTASSPSYDCFARLLLKEMVRSRKISPRATRVAGAYLFYLPPEDWERVSSIPDLTGCLSDFLWRQAHARGYLLLAPPVVEFRRQPELLPGQFRLESFGHQEQWAIHCAADESAAMLLNTPRLLCGRSADCDIVISHPAVSRYHARLIYGASAWLIKDLGSKNGTFVSGKKVMEATMGADDFFSLGPVGFTLRRDKGWQSS